MSRLRKPAPRRPKIPDELKAFSPRGWPGLDVEAAIDAWAAAREAWQLANVPPGDVWPWGDYAGAGAGEA